MDELDDIIFEYENSTMNTDELVFKLTSYLLGKVEALEEEVQECKMNLKSMTKK